MRTDLSISRESTHITEQLRNQKQAVKSSGNDSHRYEPPGDKATPEQQVRPAEQHMDTCGEAMPVAFWISRCHKDQQQADQQGQPVGLKEADRVVRSGEDMPERADAAKVAQELKDQLRTADERQKGAVGTHERSARFV